MNKIKPKKVLFIKLGAGGAFETNCIEKDQNLRLDYNEADHELCIKRDWKGVNDYYTTIEKKRSFVATSHSNQIKQFYEEDEQTLWITFYANKLWWCFSKPEITLLPDKTKTRPVIGKWSDKDINGKLLNTGNISGKLLKTQGYQGTICAVLEAKYAVSKINGELLPEVAEVENAMKNLKDKTAQLIQHLQWQDFEILIEMIFSQSGWQRVGATGKAQKTFDLDLLAPVSGDRAMVQIKSESDLKQFQEYQKKFEIMNDGYNRFFYVVHSPSKNLIDYQNDSNIQLFLVEKISELTIASGLVEWVIKKAS